MRVLVTGSAGFIGRRLVRALAAGGHVVAGLDKHETSESAGAEYVCDILDADSLTRAVRDFAPDAVVHLAARTDLDGVALEGYAANIDGVSNLVEAVRSTPSVRRCIWTSSQLVCRVGYVPRHPLDYQPDTLYGRSKVKTEEIVRASDGGGREWTLVRPTTIWGPGVGPHYQRLLRMIRAGHYFHVGRAPLMKSYGYVDNVVYQYGRLLEAPRSAVHGSMFFLADYEPIDLIAWCNGLQAAFGAPRIRTLPRAVAAWLARGGDLLNVVGFRTFPLNSFRLNNVLTEYRFDLSATQAVCGPLPFTMQQGIEQTVSWFEGLEKNRPHHADEGFRPRPTMPLGP